MTHRLINWALLLAILFTMFSIQFLDASDIESEMVKERREWSYAITHCHRVFGPQTQPEYDDNGKLICVGARGQKYAEVK